MRYMARARNGCARAKHNIYIKFIPFQRHPTDKAYFIAKEILMTERTYKKDLEVINLVGGGSPNLIKQFTWYLLLIKDKDRSVKKILSPMKNFEVINFPALSICDIIDRFWAMVICFHYESFKKGVLWIF